MAVARLDDGAGATRSCPRCSRRSPSEVAALDTDPAVRCIVIAGTDRAFATGGGALNDELSLRLWDGLAACRTPTVAAVSGYALDRGLELALLCDMVVASETAELGLPEITVGLSPGGGATQRLARDLGRRRAMELVLTGRRIDASEAARLGLVNQVAGKRDWLERALELAERGGAAARPAPWAWPSAPCSRPPRPTWPTAWPRSSACTRRRWTARSTRPRCARWPSAGAGGRPR